MKAVVPLFVSSLLILCAQETTAEKGVVEGQVVHESSRGPVRKATVMLQGLNSSGMFGDAVQSGADGKFRFESVPIGNYKIMAMRNGFVSGFNSGTTIEVGPGGATGVVVPLTPQAALNGRVLDEDEEPVMGVFVQAEPVRQKNGNGAWAGQGSTATTNDRGEFRLFGLGPGKYRVRANANPGMDRNALRQVGGGRGALKAKATAAEEAPVATYFPSEVSAQEASVVALAPGEDRQGIEIRMRKNRLFTVSGHVSTPAGWKPSLPPNAPADTVEVVPLGMAVLLPAKPGTFGINGSGQIQRDGTFVISGVAPGEYKIQASLMSFSADGRQPPLAASVRASVTAADVAGIEISIQPPVSVHGAMTFRGDKPASQDLSVHLIVNDPTDAGMMAPQAAKVDLTTGRFQMEKVAVGEYRVNVSANNAPDHYLEAVKVNGADIGPDGLVHVQGGGPVNLFLTTAAPGGVVKGVALDDKGEAKARAKVVLWPESGPYLIHLVQFTDTGDGGKYEFRGVKPGKYRIAAFSSLELSGYGMMQFPQEASLKEMESKAEKIQVEGGGAETVVAKLKVLAEEKE
jgi:hypothetical protein